MIQLSEFLMSARREPRYFANRLLLNNGISVPFLLWNYYHD